MAGVSRAAMVTAAPAGAGPVIGEVAATLASTDPNSLASAGISPWARVVTTMFLSVKYLLATRMTSAGVMVA